MMFERRNHVFWFSSILSLVWVCPVWANDSFRNRPTTELPALPAQTSIDRHTIIREQAEIAQEIAQDSIAQVTQVRLNQTEAGLEVILEADQPLVVSAPSIVGNALITEISNATLVGEPLRQDEPIAGIARIEVTELPGNRLRVAVTGTESPPTATVSAEDTGLTLVVTQGTGRW